MSTQGRKSAVSAGRLTAARTGSRWSPGAAYGIGEGCAGMFRKEGAIRQEWSG